MASARAVALRQVRSGVRLRMGAWAAALVKGRGAAPLARWSAPGRAARLPDPYRGAPEVEPVTAAPEEAAWREVAGALRSYAVICKARLALIVIGGPLLLLLRGLEAGGSEAPSGLLLGFLPVLAAVIDAGMVLSLSRLSRLPAGSGVGAAWIALILVVLALLAEVYQSSLAQEVLAGRAFRSTDAAEALPLVELAARLLSLASPLVLLSLLRGLALRVQDERILRLCNAAWGLIGGMLLSVGVVSALEIAGGGAGMTAAVIHGAFLLALLALAARSYLGALREVAAALERHAAGAREEKAVAAG